MNHVVKGSEGIEVVREAAPYRAEARVRAHSRNSLSRTTGGRQRAECRTRTSSEVDALNYVELRD